MRVKSLFFALAFFIAQAPSADCTALNEQPAAVNVVGCLSRAQPIIQRQAGDTLLFCGPITADGVRRFQAMLRSTDRTMQIMSLGGSLDAPIDLAEIVHDRALRVDVAGPCLSGCASFVFVAGLERRILPGGIVALHNTSTSALMLARAGAADQNLRLGPLQRRAMRESSLYQRLRISNDLLIEPQVRLDTRCIESNGADPQTGEWRFKIYSQLGFWAPTRAQWRRFGVNMTGFMPASRRQAQRALYANLPANMRAGASLAFDNRPLSNAPAFYLSRIAMCP